VSAHLSALSPGAGSQDAEGIQVPWVDALCRCQGWEIRSKWLWRRTGHINILEAEAERHLVRDLCRQGVTGRVNVLQDSRVTLLSGAKGRSSANAIRGQLCLSMPYQIGGKLYLGRHDCPSKLMPSDGPSRERDIDPPRCGPAAVVGRLRRRAPA